MLTQEIITANDSLKGLSEEQIGAIVTLSENDENEQFRVKFGEHYRLLDESIETHSGVKRNGAEKTYDFLPRAIDTMKEGYEKQIESLKGQIGGDDALKSQLESANAELKNTKDQFNELQERFKTLEADNEKKILGYRIANDIENAKSGIKFKDGLNEKAINSLVEQAVNKVKGLNPAYVEREGKEVLVFHDEKGSPINNPENKLNPYTAKELLLKELTDMGIVAERAKTGAGGKGTTPKGSLTASTQVEAQDIINQQLLAEGLIKGSRAYQTKMMQLWNDYKVSELPLK